MNGKKKKKSDYFIPQTIFIPNELMAFASDIFTCSLKGSN